MICFHVHDFIRGTKIALPRPVKGRPNRSFQWDIVRPNKGAERIVLCHLEALEACKAPGKLKITKH